MKKDPSWLLEFSDNLYSQAGEDGVIKKILSILPGLNHFCVEFGAWDGAFLSNVRRLIEQEDYSAVMIEADKVKFQELSANYNNNQKVIPINDFVSFDNENGLDNILAPHAIPKDFDFLSIDIDGNDYHVWKAISVYRPKLVCIEFNPTIPTEVDFVQEADANVNQGCSLSALCRLAKEKNYELVCALSFNAFFVDARYFPLFEIEDNSAELLRKDLSCITWLFSGYDGSIHITGSKMLQWHNIKLDESELQVIPKPLRSYPGLYTRTQRRLLRVFKWWRRSLRK